MKDHEKEMPSKMKRLFRKRWFFPAVYLSVAAIIIATVLWMQNGNESATEEEGTGTAHNYDEEAVPTAKQQEVFVEPVLAKDIEVKVPFYDEKASAEEQESALVFYNNKYYQNKGMDYTLKSGETFDVTAAMSGTVAKAEKDALLGHVVELKHSDGITTIYQSLANSSVKVGDKVEQGDVIGEAGRNQFNKDAGVHVHFEIRDNGKPVNPLDSYGKTVSAISSSEDAEVTSESEADLEEQANEENNNAENNNEENNNENNNQKQEKTENNAKQKDATSSMTNA
ncbi:M23 family metallopeptidase [Pueribacillus theae]|nr:M23 family metallopeptidase [Pueribacillus theae]